MNTEKIDSSQGRAAKITYWITTLWLALGMTSTGVVQIIGIKEQAEVIEKLGYPEHLMPYLGVWKLLGVIAILIPKFPLLKEWTYAGFFFLMAGAIFSHIAINDDLLTLFGPVLLVVLTLLSWYFRPETRKIAYLNKVIME